MPREGYSQCILRCEHLTHAGMAKSQRRLALIQAAHDLRRGGGFARSWALCEGTPILVHKHSKEMKLLGMSQKLFGKKKRRQYGWHLEVPWLVILRRRDRCWCRAGRRGTPPGCGNGGDPGSTLAGSMRRQMTTAEYRDASGRG